MNSISKIYQRFFIFSLYFFSLTSFALAQVTPIVPENPTNFSNLGELVNRLVEIAMFFVAIVAVLYLIMSGFRYIMAGGDEKKAAAARASIQNAIIGLIVAFIAFLIVKFVLINFLDVKTSFLGDWEDRASEFGI